MQKSLLFGLFALTIFAAVSCNGGPSAPTAGVPFNTPLPRLPQQPVTLYATGDIADCDAGHNNVLNGHFGHEYVGQLLSTLGLDGVSRVFLAIGDLAYFQGSLRQFQNCYQLTFGIFKSFTRPTPGNHEYETPGGTDYYSYFGSIAGSIGQGYYSWNPSGDWWHVVSGNSNLTGAAHSAYLSWLENDLASNSRPCTVVYEHYPRFSSGSAGNQREVEGEFELMYRYHVDLYLSGHDHNYERFRPQTPSGGFDERGVTQFVVGTGGAELRPILGRQPNSVVVDNSSWGVLSLTLESGTYRFQFLKATGTFADSGAGTCNGVGTSIQIRKK